MKFNIGKNLLSKEKWKQNIIVKNKKSVGFLFLICALIIAYIYISKKAELFVNAEKRKEAYELSKKQVVDIDKKLKVLRLNQKTKLLSIPPLHLQKEQITDYLLTTFASPIWLEDAKKRKIKWPANKEIVVLKTNEQDYYYLKGSIFKELKK